MKKVEIVWIDATGGDGWVEKDKVQKMKLPEMNCTGYLVEEDIHKITITMGFDKENYGAYLLIPKKSIIKITHLK